VRSRSASSKTVVLRRASHAGTCTRIDRKYAKRQQSLWPRLRHRIVARGRPLPEKKKSPSRAIRRDRRCVILARRRLLLRRPDTADASSTESVKPFGARARLYPRAVERAPSASVNGASSENIASGSLTVSSAIRRRAHLFHGVHFISSSRARVIRSAPLRPSPRDAGARRGDPHGPHR